MIYIIFGEDRYLIRREIDRLKGSAEVESVESPTPSELADKILTPSLFAPNKTLIVKDFVFSDNESLHLALNNLPAHLTLIFDCPEGFDGRKKYIKQLKDQVEVIECQGIPEWEEEKLLEWIREEAKAAGKPITSLGAELLLDSVGRNPGMLISELSKLAIFAKDLEEITETEVEALVSRSGYNAFTLSEAINAREDHRALAALKKLIMEKEDLVKLLALISHSVRHVYKTKLLMSRGWDRYKIAAELKARPYFIGKCLAAAERYTLAELEKNLALLYKTDLGLKSGLDQPTQMYLMLAEMMGEKR